MVVKTVCTTLWVRHIDERKRIENSEQTLTFMSNDFQQMFQNNSMGKKSGFNNNKIILNALS